LFIGIFVLSISLKIVSAQPEIKNSIAVKLNYLSPLWGAVTVHSEIPISKINSSANVFFTVGFRRGDGTGMEGYGIGAEFKYYFTGSALNGGFNISPYFRYRDLALWGEYTETVNGIVTEEGSILHRHQHIRRRHYSVQAMVAW
jgi:hypothetical protein